jgi:hypothetical protein
MILWNMILSFLQSGEDKIMVYKIMLRGRGWAFVNCTSRVVRLLAEVGCGSEGKKIWGKKIFWKEQFSKTS